MRISSIVVAISSVLTLPASAQTPASYTPPPSCTATLPPPVVAGPQMSQYAADRNNAMAAARLAFNCRDYEASYQLYLKALESYPNDAAALQTTAMAASFAGHDNDAIALYKRTLQHEPRFTYPVRANLMSLYIHLGRWSDFQSARLEARVADHAGTLTNSRDEPFTFEQLPVAALGSVRVVEFPGLYGPDHTLDRFMDGAELDSCTNFAPHVDLVDDNPAAGAEATYSLVAFPAPTTKWKIKTYPKGEPPYQDVRADVQAALSKPLTSIKPPAICASPTPSATNGGLSASTGH